MASSNHPGPRPRSAPVTLRPAVVEGGEVMGERRGVELRLRLLAGVVEGRHVVDALAEQPSEPPEIGHVLATVREGDVQHHQPGEHQDHEHGDHQEPHVLTMSDPAEETPNHEVRTAWRPRHTAADGRGGTPAGAARVRLRELSRVHRTRLATASRITSGTGVAGRAGSVLSTYTTTTRPSAAASSPSWNRPTR